MSLALSIPVAALSLPINPDLPFRMYSVTDGLNQKTPLALAQDHDGFIWVATFGGLNRFDGHDFSSYTTRQGLRQNLIQALTVDSQNRLWAGDTAGGLTLIEGGNVTRTFEPDDQNIGVVRTIVEVGDTLYVGTQPGGMRSLKLSSLDDGFSKISTAPNEVFTMVVRSPDDILVLSTIGLHTFKPGADPEFELIYESASTLTTDESGRIAVGDKSGRIGWVNQNSIDWMDIQYDGSVSGIVMRGGEITWVDLEAQGMVQFGDPTAHIVLPYGGIAPSIYDQEGVLWIPARTGLARYLGSRFKHYSLEQDGVIPEVFSVVPGINGDYWFGTSSGVIHVDQTGVQTNVWNQLGIELREVRDVRISNDKKTLWAGGVQTPTYAIDLATLKIKKTMGDINTVTVSLAIDDKGRVWTGSYLGTLSVYDPETDSSKTYTIGTGASVYSLYLADDGYLWFSANYKGIHRLNINDPEAQPELIVDDEKWSLEVYAQVVVRGSGDDTTAWFTGIQGGVFRWKNGVTTRVISEVALSDKTIYSIAPLPDNTLVLATSRGAYRYDIETEALELYTALDGFVALEAKIHANYYEGGDTLLIGTTSGLTAMDVSQPMTGVGTPKPLITKQTVDDVVVDNPNALPQDAKFAKVLIEFTAVSTRKPFGVEYSYRLEGQDKNWSAPSETSSMGYSNLYPGQYLFEVRARLPGGEWSAPVGWAFTVPTPFWLTPWFIALSVFSVLGLIWLGIRLRLRAIARVNRRLREEVAERTESIEAGRRELEVTNQHLSSEIQERKKADALRKEVETRFHQAYQNSPVGMALVDTEGLVYDANPKMKSLFWPRSRPEDREPLIDVVTEEYREQFSKFLYNHSNESPDENGMEVDCVTDSGEVRRIGFHPSSVRDQEGDLNYIVLLAQDVTESRAMTDQLEYQARFDELTGLVNRRAFSERLEEVDTEPSDNSQTFLMFMDLDQFKVVNDTCGHAAGDELLRVVARLIERCVREHDTVARLGGDEFALIIVGCTQEVALQRAENVRQIIQDLEFMWEDEVFRIGASIGVVPVAQSVRDLNELQQLADAACYAAKEAGRNRVHLVSGKEDAAHEHRGEMRWVQRLNHAIDTDSFVLFGQRIAPMNEESEQSERVEVLLRMVDRERDPVRLIPPGAFLPAAERYGLQGKLDHWVISKVIDVLSEQDPDKVAKQSFWVNLSGATVGDSNISHELIRRVREANLPPGCLNFELTETAVIRKIDDAATLIESLQSMGCRFALDDFGSGLSSFGYLKRLNVDYIKIDGEFVRDIVTDPTDRIFVKSIIDIAHTLGMSVVAEFVEDEEILQMVRSLGSDYAQGFGIHRPEPLEALVSTRSKSQAVG